MKAAPPVRGQIAARGEQIYQEKLRSLLEPAHRGEIVIINIETGEYELDSDHLAAVKRARSRWPQGLFFAVRVGFPTLGHIGARFRTKAE